MTAMLGWYLGTAWCARGVHRHNGSEAQLVALEELHVVTSCTQNQASRAAWWLHKDVVDITECVVATLHILSRLVAAGQYTVYTDDAKLLRAIPKRPYHGKGL